MVNFILELISFNEGVDYSVVTKIVVLYLVLLWVFVSVWVFNDAKARFNNLLVAGILALLNLILSFPFLLIYLLIRPSHREEWDDASDGGINIPVANFTGKDGVVISLQLKIDSKKILDEKIDYNLDVVLNKENEEPSTGKIEISAQDNDTLSINNINTNDDLKITRKPLTKLKEKFSNMVTKLKEKLSRNRDNVDDPGEDEDDSQDESTSNDDESTDSEVRSNSKKKKKNKKGKKKKNR
jgi:hypothetical protein